MYKHTTLSILLSASLLLPQVAVAATVSAIDTVAGLGTEVAVEGLPQGTEATLVVVPPYGPEEMYDVTASSSNRAFVELAGTETQVAGTYTVELLSDGAVSARGTFIVHADSVDRAGSTVQIDRQSVLANGNDTATISIILRDRYGNTLSGRPLQLISSRNSDMISPLASETDASGRQDFLLSTREPGNISLRAVDLISGETLHAETVLFASNEMGLGGPYDTYPSYNYNTYPSAPTYYPSQPTYTNTYAPQPQVPSYSANILGRQLYGQATGFGPLAGFKIKAPKEMNVNEDATISITAVDAEGRKVEDYTGMVLLSSTDPAAILPLTGEVQFLPSNLGEKTLTLGLRFRTPGEHLLYAEDRTNRNIHDEVIVSVIGEGGLDPTILVTSHRDGDSVNTPRITIEGEATPFVNLMVTGGIDDVRGETDRNGEFALEIELDEDRVDHTIRVRDENGRFDSGNIHLTLDNTPPEIGEITFDPASPEAGDLVQVTVLSDEGITVEMTLEDETYALDESRSSSGTYTTEFIAPDAGNYQAVIRALDDAENDVEVRSTLVINRASLPIVQGVTAEPQANAVSLKWTPLTSERVDAYRIYVGEDPGNFLYTLDTDRATAAATVAGLEPGKMYYFAVTALQGDRESISKSDLVTASALGLAVEVTPQDGALLIEWGKLGGDTPLSSYLLEYGVEPGSYIEQRTLSGELQAFNLRDLINGVAYFISVTPVTTTGDVLRDLAATGEGTPNGGGFNPDPSVPIPSDLIPDDGRPSAPLPPYSDVIHPPSETPTTGIPGWTAWVVIGFVLTLFTMQWQRRRSMRMTMDFLREMEARYHQ